MVQRAVLKGDKLVWEDDAGPAVPAASRKDRLAAGQPRKGGSGVLDTLKEYGKSALQTGKDAIRSAADTATGIVEGGTQGYTWGLRPRLEGAAAAILAPPNLAAFGGKEVDLADRYNKQKAYSEKANVNAQQAAPLTYGGSELAGAIASPITKLAGPAGAIISKVPGGARVVKGLKALDEATTVNKAVRPVASAVVSGAKAGAAGGAATGAINAPDWTDPRDVLSKAGSGAMFGLGAGGLLGGLAVPAGNIVANVGQNVGRRLGTLAGVAVDKAGNLVQDARKLGERAADAFKGDSAHFAARRGNAARIKEEAQQEVFDALGTSGVTPKMADTSAATAAAQGGAPVTADASRATQGVLKGAYDKGVKGAKELADNLQSRAVARGGRVRQFMANLAGLNPSTTVGGATRASKARAKAMAGQDYDPAQWGQAIAHTPEIDKFFSKNRGLLQPYIDKASTALRASENPLPTHQVVNGMRVPSIGLMDAAVKGLKEHVNTLMQGEAPDKVLGNSLKTKADALDNILKSQNPVYAKALSRQATEFATQDALKLGQQLSGKLFSNPRETHDLMVAYNLKHPNNPGELRQAMLSALFDKSVSMRQLPGKIREHLDEKAEPEVKAIWRFMMRNDDNVGKLRAWAKTEKPLGETEDILRGGSVTNFAGQGKEVLERGERSGNASIGRAGLGAMMKNWAMLGSNAANAMQRAMQGHNAAYNRALQARVVKELGATTKPGELAAKAAVLKAARLTRQEARARGIRRAARVAGHEAAGFTDPGADDNLYGANQ